MGRTTGAADGDLIAATGTDGGRAELVDGSFFTAGALNDDVACDGGITMEFEEGRVGVGATTGWVAGWSCGTRSLIFVGCSPALAYVGMV